MKPKLPQILNNLTDYFRIRTRSRWVILVLVIAGAGLILNSSLNVQAAWWNSSWNYKQAVTLDNNSGGALSDYHVRVVIDSSNTNFWTNVKTDGSDVRFVDSTEATVLDHYALMFDNANDVAIYWVKVNSVPTGLNTIGYMYYGNAAATNTSSKEDTFSSSSNEERFFLTGFTGSSNSAQLMTFYDNNTIEVGSGTTYVDNDLDTGSTDNPVSISTTYTSNGVPAAATKPIMIETSAGNGAELWGSRAWQGTEFVTTFYRGGTHFAFTNPGSSTATVTVYKDGVQVDNFTISAGAQVQKTGYTHTSGAHWRVVSDIPVLTFQRNGSNNDFINTLPPSLEVFGTLRQTRVICSIDNTTVTVYESDGTSQTNGDCDQNEVWAVSGGNIHGDGPSARIVASKPIFVISHADGDGTESQAWYRADDLDTEHAFALAAEYIACTAPYENTTITITDADGTQLDTSNDLGTNGADYPHHWLGGSNGAATYPAGGTLVNSDKPITCYYEEDVQGQERNMGNVVLNRKGSGLTNNAFLGSQQENSDTNPPTPDPMTFASNPNGDAGTSVSMTASTATDGEGSTPVEYYFEYVACGTNPGTGGTDSGWQTLTSYTDSGLQNDKCYGYRVKARDSAGNETTYSSTVETTTAANVPGAPTLNNATATTLDLLNAANNNPSNTTFTIQIYSTDTTWNNQWVDQNGDPSVVEVWLTDAQLDAITLQGLDPNTQYDAKSKARNADNDETELSATGSGTTTAASDTNPPTPDPMTFASNPNGDAGTSVSMTASTATDGEGSTPVEYYFEYVACGTNPGTGGTDSGWQTLTSYTDSGLQNDKCYGYRVKARDSAGNETTYSSTVEVTTNPVSASTGSVRINGGTRFNGGVRLR